MYYEYRLKGNNFSIEMVLRHPNDMSHSKE